MKRILLTFVFITFILISFGISSAQVQPGDTLTFGHYEQDANQSNGTEAIEWQVLTVENNRALILSKYGLDMQSYHSARQFVTWETSSLRAWLNSDFYSSAFSSEEQGRIVQVTNSNPNNPASKASGGNATQDRIFLLSIDEANKYLTTSESLKCIATPYANAGGSSAGRRGFNNWWWLRSPGWASDLAALVDFMQEVNTFGNDVYNTVALVRPALWLDLSAGFADAVNEAPTDELPVTTISSDQSVAVGDIITFGAYEQDANQSNGTEAIEWQVLAVENGRALLISRLELDLKPYNIEQVDITWENCTLRDWLNGEFYNSVFSTAEKARIAEVVNSNPENPEYGTEGGSDTMDRVFLLSIDEVNQYFDNDGVRQCLATDYASQQNDEYLFASGYYRWWLRSPGIIRKTAAIVEYNGIVNVYGTYVDDNGTFIVSPVAVRPAFWLNL